MDIDQIKEIIKCVKENDIEGITIEIDNEKISITNRKSDNISMKSIEGVEEKYILQSEKNNQNTNVNIKNITSPMVGVVGVCKNKKTGNRYSVGDKIIKGEAVFTVEAMKLLNEVLSSDEGIIEEILLEDGDIVEYNQPVIKIKCNR